jgi:hypothetical protein
MILKVTDCSDVRSFREGEFLAADAASCVMVLYLMILGRVKHLARLENTVIFNAFTCFMKSR